MAMPVVGSHGRVTSDINVTPMIDVMLVLLIIFMIVTPIISAGFQARIPEGRNIEGAPEDLGDVVLGIDRNGRYYLDPGTGAIAPIVSAAAMQAQDDSLASILTRVFRTRTTDKILYFKADANLEYSVVAPSIEIARRSGVRVLASITEQPIRSRRRR